MEVLRLMEPLHVSEAEGAEWESMIQERKQRDKADILKRADMVPLIRTFMQFQVYE